MNIYNVRKLMPLMVLIVVAGAQAQSIQKSVAASGFTQTSNQHASISGTFGQPLIGNISNSESQTSLGFWNGDDSAASAVKPAAMLPGDLTLLQNSPNPSISETTIRFTMGAIKDVTLSIYASSGKIVSIKHLGQCAVGLSEYTYDSDELPAGTYVCTLSDGATLRTGAMTILK